jgi:hypothetical protein
MSPDADAMNPEAVTSRECGEAQRRCRDQVFRAMAGYDRAAQTRHQTQMTELSALKVQVAEQRGKANGASQERQAETAAHKPVSRNGQRSVVRELGVEILKVVIITALLGGLWAVFHREQSEAKAPPPAVARP